MAARLACFLILLAQAFPARLGGVQRGADLVDGSELKRAIEKVLQENNTPAAAVALLTPSQILWADGIGMANLASSEEASADTLFRMGSISKSFVALAVLMLQEQGKLSLDDPIAQLAPEIEFSNPWSETDPVRLAHLLEHTAGFDDIHLPEYAFNSPDLSLRDGLAFHPDSRISRWKPGTHFSYSNSGPSLAAYAVEKVTGQPFEDYVSQHIFQPLRMKTANYRLTPEVESRLARGYALDGQTELPYWHILVRPAGSLNASVREMAHFVQMLLNRGAWGDIRLVQPDSVDRMESPTTTLGAKQGMLTGYGLGNATSLEEGFLFRGHGGGMNAFLSQYGYLPSRGLGYVYAINTANGRAMREIGRLIRRFLVRDLTPPLPTAIEVPAARLRALTGYYQPITPRQELTRFVDRLLGVIRVEFQQGYLHAHPLFGERKVLIPVTERRFRGDNEPLPSLIFLDTGQGLVLQGSGNPVKGNYRAVPMVVMLAQWILAFLCLLLMLSSILQGLIWVPRRLLAKGPADVWKLRLFPLLASWCFLVAVAVLMAGLGDALLNFGEVTFYSVSFFFLSCLFPVFALLALIQALRMRKAAPHGSIFALTVSASCVLVALYLGYWGILGLRTWAA